MFRKTENGQAIVVLAIALVVLLVFAALAIDAGNAYTEKREAQNAADAAAMAGARQLVLECAKQDSVLNDPGYTGSGAVAANILNQVSKMAGANAQNATVTAYYINASGARMGQVQPPVPCTCATGARGVEVTVRSSTSSFLAGLMGKPTMDVEATAKARYGQISQVSTGLYPYTRIVVSADQPNNLGRVLLRVLDDDDVLPGNFGWLSWNGDNNVPNLAESLTPPGDSGTKYYNPGTPDNNWTPNYSDKAITVGKWVQGAPGNKNSSQVRTQLDWFIANHVPMAIPLYDAVVGAGSHANYRVGGFAAYELESYDLTGQNKHMTGKFVRWVTAGDWVPNVTCSEESGMYSVKLVP